MVIYDKVRCPRCGKELDFLEDNEEQIDMDGYDIAFLNTAYCEDCDTVINVRDGFRHEHRVIEIE